MKRTSLLLLANAAALWLANTALAENNAFSYQGKLIDDCCPASGYYDMRFKLLPAQSGGVPVNGTSPLSYPAVFVTNGLFTVSLNFGAGSQVFDGTARWLEIEVRTNNAADGFVTLSPRTELSRTHEAVFAQKAASVLNGSIIAPSIAPGQVVKSLNGLKDNVSLVAGANVTLTPSGNSIQIAATSGGSGWSLGGNAGTVQGVDFLGTTDGHPLELRAPFVGVGRNTPITGADCFSVRSPATSSYGGMYVDTAGLGLPFYGYAMQGSARAWHYLDGSDGNKWKLYNNGYHLTVTPAGNIGIGTTAPTAPLHIERAQGYARIVSTSTRNGSVLELWNYTPQQIDGPAVTLGAINFGDGSTTPGQISYQVNQGMGFRIGGAEQMRIDAGGNVTIGGTLAIHGGADLAEPFEVSEDNIPQGALVIIDEENPGRLKLSDRAYDNRVAGIISGAKGIHPGIMLKQEGALEGTKNVALTGRVYALADASEAPIKPGDLLTTSTTPGHAMKATDRDLAHGAIIGKAMTGLKAGKDYVLVLVNLQ